MNKPIQQTINFFVLFFSWKRDDDSRRGTSDDQENITMNHSMQSSKYIVRG